MWELPFVHDFHLNAPRTHTIFSNRWEKGTRCVKYVAKRSVCTFRFGFCSFLFIDVTATVHIVDWSSVYVYEHDEVNSKLIFHTISTTINFAISYSVHFVC